MRVPVDGCPGVVDIPGEQVAFGILGLENLQRLRDIDSCKWLAKRGTSLHRDGGRTVLPELLHSRHHFAVQLSGGGVVRRALARSVVVLQVGRVWSVADRPLGTLLNGKEAKGAIAFS